MKSNRVVSLLLTFALVFSMIPSVYATAQGEEIVYQDFEVTNRNRDKVDYTGTEGEELVIPATFQDTDGTWYSVTSIGRSAFSDCTSLTSVTIPNSVTSIGNNAFWNCSSLSSITIPEGVTSIGKSAFSGCTSLSSITIPDSVTNIGESAFRDCTSLTSITIPESVTSIGKGAFSGCSSLTSITIPGGVTSIGTGAFQDCTSLPSITIPEGVTSIGEGAFFGCSSLTSIIVSEANLNYYSSADGVLFNKDKTILIQYPIGNTQTSYEIPSGVTTIKNQAFTKCSLTVITIPNSVTSIENYAFQSCKSLGSVTIPESVTSIGSGAFSACTNVQNFEYMGDNLSIQSSSFQNMGSTVEGEKYYKTLSSQTELNAKLVELGYQPYVEPSEDYNTSIVVDADVAMFKVTVPILVNVQMDAQGNITTGEGYKIENKCPLGPVIVTGIHVNEGNGWELGAFDTDYKNVKASTKMIGMSINEAEVQTDGSLTLNDSLKAVINHEGSKDLTFDVKLPAQKTALTNEKVLAIVYTMDFDKI